MASRKQRILAALALLLVAGGALGYRVIRSQSGASAAYGGALEATVLPEFPSLDAGSWAVAPPVSLGDRRGQPVLIEAWAPG